jgi:serine/threonine-protein kinase
MPPSAKPDSAAISMEEEKLADTLVSRGLITREEWQQVRTAETGSGLGVMLAGLVKSGFLTAAQAQRAALELTNRSKLQIPGYKLLEKIGQGSMGTVHKARQLSMDRMVAIKVLHRRLAANKDFLARFFREAHLAAKFNSNHVVQAIDVGTAGDDNYFVMEYVDGVTIKEELENGKVFEEQEAVDIVLQIAHALQAAHRRNLIHRDVKPGNIVLTKDGTAKLADLGMARVTTDEAHVKAEKGIILGTPHYMAPEQIRGRSDIDSRADIYSLGATLFHMVTGRQPFPYPTVKEVLNAHLKEDLTPPDHINTKLSAGLGVVVEFMMAKKRKNRYPSPDELILDLGCLKRGEAPQYAQQNMSASLASLAKSEDDEEEDSAVEDEDDDAPQMVPLKWMLVLVGVLAFSCVGNMFLLLRGR